MQSISSIVGGITIALCSQFANAGQILVIKALGNHYNSYAGNWNPDHPNTDEYYRRAFTETFMFDLDSCATTNFGGSCTRMRAIIKSPTDQVWDFDSGWITPLSGPVDFSISPTGFNVNNSGGYKEIRYIDKPVPDGFPYPDFWGVYMGTDLIGSWNQQFDDFSELYGKTLRVYQRDEGYSPDGSFILRRMEPTDGTQIFETGFEFAQIYVIPEPSSIALISIALAGLGFACRRKV